MYNFTPPQQQGDCMHPNAHSIHKNANDTCAQLSPRAGEIVAELFNQWHTKKFGIEYGGQQLSTDEMEQFLKDSGLLSTLVNNNSSTPDNYSKLLMLGIQYITNHYVAKQQYQQPFFHPPPTGCSSSAYASPSSNFVNNCVVEINDTIPSQYDNNKRERYNIDSGSSSRNSFEVHPKRRRVVVSAFE